MSEAAICRQVSAERHSNEGMMRKSATGQLVMIFALLAFGCASDEQPGKGDAVNLNAEVPYDV
jgi:hypothetical protein